MTDRCHHVSHKPMTKSEFSGALNIRDLKHSVALGRLPPSPPHLSGGVITQPASLVAGGMEGAMSSREPGTW